MNGHHFQPRAIGLAPTHLAIVLILILCVAADAGERIYWLDAVEPNVARSPELMEQGKLVYERRCVLCHGKSGLADGVAADYLPTRPRDFSTGQFKFLTTQDFPSDEDLFRSITVGFPAYGMPEFTYLNARDRWGLVYYIKELGRIALRDTIEAELIEERLGVLPHELSLESATQHRDTLAKIRAESEELASYRFESGRVVRGLGGTVPTTNAVRAGKESYVALGCDNCHGDSGSADGPSSGNLLNEDGRKTRARAFAASRWYFKAGDRTKDIARVLMTGMPGTPMPSFDGGPESHADLWNTARYVRSLANLGNQDVKGAHE